MTIEKLKKKLNQLGYIHLEIESLQEQIEIINNKLINTSASTNEIKTKSYKDVIGELTALLLENKKTLMKKEKALIKNKNEMIYLISLLDTSIYKTILMQIYINRKKIDELDIGYSYSHVRRLKGEAIKELLSKINIKS